MGVGLPGSTPEHQSTETQDDPNVLFGTHARAEFTSGDIGQVVRVNRPISSLAVELRLGEKHRGLLQDVVGAQLCVPRLRASAAAAPRSSARAACPRKGFVSFIAAHRNAHGVESICAVLRPSARTASPARGFGVRASSGLFPSFPDRASRHWAECRALAQRDGESL